MLVGIMAMGCAVVSIIRSLLSSDTTFPGLGDHGKPAQNFFLLLSKVTVRYLKRGGFRGSFTIGTRSSLPSAYTFSKKRPSPSKMISIFIGFFGIPPETSAREFGSLLPAEPLASPRQGRHLPLLHLPTEGETYG